MTGVIASGLSRVILYRAFYSCVLGWDSVPDLVVAV
jgi:hypothetical protein